MSDSSKHLYSKPARDLKLALVKPGELDIYFPPLYSTLGHIVQEVLTLTTKTRNREPIIITITGDRAVISGDAYIHRDKLKYWGFVWNFGAKHWHGSAEFANEVANDIISTGANATVITSRLTPLPVQPTFPTKYRQPTITVTLTYDGFSIDLPATANQIEMLYRHVTR